MLRVVLVIGIVVYVIGRQLLGEPLRGKRVVILPVVLAIAGLVDLSHTGHHLQAVDVACLVVSGLVAAGIGLAQGTVMRIESRDGYLWGQLPGRGLLLWLGLVASRVVMTVVAVGLHAHVASSSATILLMLGINRVAQAAVVVVRAMSTGVPFAPEKDGRSILTNLTGERPGAAAETPQRPVPTLDWSALRRQATDYLNNRNGH